MARRQKKPGYVVSLFPFLSILACVIGVLTLLITAMALGQMDEQAIRNARIDIHNKTEMSRIYEELLDGVKSTEEQVIDTRRKIAEAMALKKKLEDAREELKQLDARLITAASEGDPQAVQLLAELHNLRNRISEYKSEMINITNLLTQMKKELGLRSAPTQQAVVKIRGGGSGAVDEIKQVPTFIECTASTVVVYHNIDKKTRIRRSSLAGSDSFGKVLRAIKETNNGIAVFLVREDGVRTYFIARSVARTIYCPHGKLPVMGQGKLDLSAFDEIIRERAVPLDLGPSDDEPEIEPAPAAPTPGTTPK